MLANKLAAQMRNVNLHHFAQVELRDALGIMKTNALCIRNVQGIPATLGIQRIRRLQRGPQLQLQQRQRCRLASVHQDGAPMAAQHLTTPKIAMVTECPTHNVKACQPRVSLDISHPPKIAMTNGGEVTMSKTVCRLKHCWNHNQKSISIAGGLA